MDYIEVKFTYTSAIPANIINDVLAGELASINYEAFSPEAEYLLAYIRKDQFNMEQLGETLQSFPLEDVLIHFTEKLIPSEDWNEEWEKNYFKPVVIDNRCLIKASFHQVDEPYEYIIIIDPKMAFGTGNHETTHLMLSQLLKEELTDQTVLDMGCGTAVLALLAEKRGAKQVLGVEIDEDAYKNALENIKLNNSKHIEVRLGGAERLKEGELFDIVVANINRNILVEDMPIYAKHLNKGGKLFLSGFYKEDVPVIADAGLRQGLSVSEVNSMNNWVVACATRK